MWRDEKFSPTRIPEGKEGGDAQILYILQLLCPHSSKSALGKRRATLISQMKKRTEMPVTWLISFFLPPITSSSPSFIMTDAKLQMTGDCLRLLFLYFRLPLIHFMVWMSFAESKHPRRIHEMGEKRSNLTRERSLQVRSILFLRTSVSQNLNSRWWVDL